MNADEIKRVLKLEAALAQCQNALEEARQRLAQAHQRAKAKAKKVKR